MRHGTGRDSTVQQQSTATAPRRENGGPLGIGQAILRAMKAMQAQDEAIAPQRNAWRKIDALVTVLTQLTERDPEQEVHGMALPVLTEVINLARGFVADDPVVGVMQDAISPDFILGETSVRAADALLVATQLRTALHEFRLVGPQV
jgi:hypothetical protein